MTQIFNFSAGPAVLPKAVLQQAAHDMRGETRELAVVVLLKGATTVCAAPDGRTLVQNEGGAELATAGTGDVLAGTIGALLASGMAGREAAAAGTWLHAAAASLRPAAGLVASDVVAAIPRAIELALS